MEKEADKAREYFKNAGLSYSDITEGEILSLVLLTSKELKSFNKEANKTDKERYNLTLSKKIDVLKYRNSTIKSCFLYCNGGYFVKREAISFNEDGFIGFAGWASSYNEKPFLDAFYKWVDLIK